MSDLLSDQLAAELLRHFDGIVAMGLDEAAWVERESSDMFQSEHFSGGFDATEGEFLFSYYPDDGGEFWIGASLAAVTAAAIRRCLPEGLHVRVAE